MGILETLGLRARQQIVKQVYQPNDFKNSEGFRLLKPSLEQVPEPAPSSTIYNVNFQWETPTVPFVSIYDYYRKDPGIQSAINAFRNEIMGAGFYVTADDTSVQELVEKWNNDTEFEKTLFIMIGDLLLLGSSLIEVARSGSSMKIFPVDMRSIISMRRDKFGQVESYIQQTPNQGYVLLDPKKFIHFKLIEVGRRAWPISIIQAMVEPFFEFEGESWSLADGAALMRQDTLRMIHKQAAPRLWHIYENSSEELLKAQATRDKTMKAGERGYTSQKFDIMTEDIGVTSRFKNEYDFITNAVENALQAPTAKLMTATGISNATYASAEAARAMFEMSISGYQRKWKEEIENYIYKPILGIHGFDLTTSKLQFNWGMKEKPKLELQDVIAVRTSGEISREEFRQMLKDMGWPLSEDQTTISQQDLQSELLRKQIELLQTQKTESDAKLKLAEKLLKGRLKK